MSVKLVDGLFRAVCSSCGTRSRAMVTRSDCLAAAAAVGWRELGRYTVLCADCNRKLEAEV